MKGPLARIRRRRSPDTSPPPPAEPPTAPTEAVPAPAPSLFGAPPTVEQTMVAPTGPAAEAAQLPADVTVEQLRAPSFRDRGRLRRRLRYLRRVRELGFRDLGGLVFDLDRFGRHGDHLVRGKLAALRAVDDELRALERALDERRDVIELREPGIAACPRCGSLHGSDARYCPSCGVGLRGPRAVAEVAHVEDAGAAPVPLPPPAGPEAAAPIAVPPPVPPAAAAPPPVTQPTEAVAAVVPEQEPEPEPAPEPEPTPEPEPEPAAQEREAAPAGDLSWSQPPPPPADSGTPPGESGSLSWGGEEQPTEVIRPSDSPDPAERQQ